jgi:hypothetical protein
LRDFSPSSVTKEIGRCDDRGATSITGGTRGGGLLAKKEEGGVDARGELEDEGVWRSTDDTKEEGSR